MKKKKYDLFDIMVASVINYASDNWGFHRGNDVEIIHKRFCPSFLNLGKSLPNCFLYGELGCLPMYAIRKQKNIKYWLNIVIVTHKPLIVYDIYILLLRDASNGKNNGFLMFMTCCLVLVKTVYGISILI